VLVGPRGRRRRRAAGAADPHAGPARSPGGDGPCAQVTRIGWHGHEDVCVPPIPSEDRTPASPRAVSFSAFDAKKTLTPALSQGERAGVRVLDQKETALPPRPSRLKMLVSGRDLG